MIMDFLHMIFLMFDFAHPLSLSLVRHDASQRNYLVPCLTRRRLEREFFNPSEGRVVKTICGGIDKRCQGEGLQGIGHRKEECTDPFHPGHSMQTV